MAKTDYSGLTKEQLIELLIAQKVKIEEQEVKIEEQDAKIEEQKVRILYLQRQLYGRRSEKRLPDPETPGQVSLFGDGYGAIFLEGEEEVVPLVEEIKKKHEKRKTAASQARTPRTYRLPENLRREEVVIEPQLSNPELYVKIGEDVTETLEVKESEFYVKRVIRPKYILKDSADQDKCIVEQSPAPLENATGYQIGNSIHARIIVDKFAYHLPEYRQVERFKSHGIKLSRSTINRGLHRIAFLLQPLYLRQMEEVLSTGYIQVDETVVPINDGRHKGRTRKGYIWAVRSADPEEPRGSFFYCDGGSRSGETLRKMLRDYQGALQSDGYEAYSQYEDKQGVLPLGCLAHVRRKYETALQSGDERASKALEYISLLYQVEDNLKREENISFETIADERLRLSYPILQQFERWMESVYPSVTPKSPLGKALSYAFGMLPRISRYCKDGRYEIDNNAIERMIRPIAVGRKNYLFVENDETAEDHALYYTFMSSCEQAGVNFREWLMKILPIARTIEKLSAEQLKSLLPANITI